jgi:ABC-type nitrate/sulfonate/bicarbonate transport system substrate-binding protein
LKTPRRRTVLAALGAAALTTPSLAFAQELRIVKAAGVPEDTAMPVVWAQQSGLFRRLGLDVQLASQRSGAVIVAGVTGGEYQIGKSSLPSLILAHTKGLPFVLIAPGGLYDAAVPAGMLLVKSDSPLRSAADLNGKTVSVSSLSDIYSVATKAWVDQNGGDQSTLKLVEVAPSLVPEAIATGRVDAGNVSIPELPVALDSGRFRVLGHTFDSIGPRYMVTGWFSTIEFAAKNPQVIERFARGVRDGAVYGNGHHQQLVDLEAKFTGLDPSVIAKMSHYTYGSSLEPRYIQPVIDYSAKYKLIVTSFDARELVYAPPR